MFLVRNWMWCKGILRPWSTSLRVRSAYCAVTGIVYCFGLVSGRIILNKSQMNVGGERRKITSNKEGYYQLSSQCWSYGAEKWKQGRLFCCCCCCCLKDGKSSLKNLFWPEFGILLKLTATWHRCSSTVKYWEGEQKSKQASKTREGAQILCPFRTTWPVASLAAAESKSINSEKNTDLARIKCSFWVFPTAVSGLNPGKSFSRVIFYSGLY